MDTEEAGARLLAAAERLFYERGIQAVGIDEVRGAAGVSLKRLYQCFRSKEDLVAAYLRARDERWRADLAAHVDEGRRTPRGRVLAVFDWLTEWFAKDDFRGCAFINAHGELGAHSSAVAEAVRAHKDAVLGYLRELAEHAAPKRGRVLGDQLLLLVDGAIVVAGIQRDPDAAKRAKQVAAGLL
ncbi:TetR/AcrR family transcriptional regulator [Allokutzneria albata]|uniref:DNA-binding transcriptional regulator, AcrR family n=1 Tax=Allokutzneria albata TaxID=211114 RepID=A0A1G9WVD5_ALLAB|nr:TetR/AcrR family transcriptional regulator [Allokutzneria albata]SDM88096.1 DNA-binding transcriptional regulator, AcrR family [Allokutzneria albata]